MQFSGLKWRLLVRHGGILVLMAFVAGVVFVWSGFYNVAASSDHWVVTTWILEQVRVKSVATRSYFVEDPPPLDDPDMVRLGAAHYEGGCSPCHSRPGEPINVIVRGMLPVPPLLAGSIVNDTQKELFWIIKHGLKYTAMPAWPAQKRDDEVWALTAFVARLPSLSPEEYGALAGMDRAPQKPTSGDRLATSSETVALTQCVRCHGDASSPPISALVPILNGQSQVYMERALSEYAAGLRPSGVMQPAADLLGDAERRRLAAFYAQLDRARQNPDGEQDRIARGRELALQGDTERGIPPCLACHSGRRGNAFPSLAGQYAAYLANQLHVWRSGGRDLTTYGQIMAPIARRLTDEQVKDAAAYFASLGTDDPSDGAVSTSEALQ